MSFLKRLSTCLSISSLTLALAVFPVAYASAQTAVETYIDQAVPDAIDPNVTPEGMVWNKPLKAGDMVLPRLSKPKESTTKTKVPTLPVGELKAPQLAGVKTGVQAPKISNSTSSTQSIMLLQGMKTALKQSGQNADIPKSDMIEIDPSELGKAVLTSKALAPASAVGAKHLLSVPDAAASAQVGETKPYVKGQEPKGWNPSASSSAAGQAAPSEETGADIAFPPEMAGAKAFNGNEPKATELADQPLSLENSAAPEKKKEQGLLERMAKPFTSIFGEPVKETGEKDKKAASDPVGKADPKSCEASIAKWTRECADAGYPAHFVGQISGETRISCPSGDSKDVWLSNSCAAPIASSAYSVQQQKASSLTDSPVGASIAKIDADTATSKGAVIVTDMDTTTDGSCGVANGLAADAKPAGDLCSQGEATAVLGEGPWRWSCKGRRGGMSVSCAAPLAAPGNGKKSSKSTGLTTPAEALLQDGKCGEAEGVGTETAPSTGLCVKGSVSRVNGNGPWTWACSGSNGGTAAACMAPKKTDGVCGESHDAGFDSMPTHNLCTAGYASAVTGNGPWNWTCSGLYGGSASTCVATTKVNGVCGPASMTGHRTLPQDGLCNVGEASSISGSGPWAWSCKGSAGGATVRCAAPLVRDGECGAANGNRFTKAPQEELCAMGSATRVSGMGPWNWTCSGSEGGNTASCTASLGADTVTSSVICGEAAESLPIGKPSSKLCKTGKPSAVSGAGPWTWTCDDGAGHSQTCSTIVATDGACGLAVTIKSSTPPTEQLCSFGTATNVDSIENKAWKWECQATLGGKTAECLAPKVSGGSFSSPAPAPSAHCGSAHGQGFADKPDSGLCETGKASSVKGNGPWAWSCSEGKTKAACEAPQIVEGACGKANGSVQRTAPSASLCTSGSATEVTGTGPWMWTCVGAGGGNSASCSAAAQAQTKVDGGCGAAVNGVVSEKPDANLCDSGMPSTVYGEGPWTWTCSGMNGGIASTCSAAKVVPKAPPPPGPAVNGVCGFSNGVASLVAPEDGLCSSGTLTALSGNGPWNWSCIGANGGMTVSCTAPLQPPAPIVGECGSATGVPTLTTPKSGLCAAGISSAVNGKGPWTWSCSGTNGGGAVSCVAPLAGKGGSVQSIPSMVTPSLEAGEAPTPRAAPVGLVTPQLTSSSLPAMKPGTVPELKVAKKDKKGKSLPEAKDIPDAVNEPASAPSVVPELPEGLDPLPPPPVRETTKPLAGVKSPVLDSEGKPVAGARLVLEPDVSTINFLNGSDQLDKDAVEIAEKLTKILIANGTARITLTAYSDTAGNLSPREARRLSLNRALALRDFMTSKGLPSSRVDIRPMGANVPSGDMDRVDVKVN